MDGAKLGLETIVKLTSSGNIPQLQHYLTPFAFTRISLLQEQEKESKVSDINAPLISILNCKLQHASTLKEKSSALLDVHYIYSLEESSNEKKESKNPTGVLYRYSTVS